MAVAFERLAHQISCIDSLYYRPRLDAYYLVQQDGEAALIDSGTSHSAAQLSDLLTAHQLTPEQIKYIIPTHAHLDHAGGCGALMAALPAATLVAHPVTAQHLIEPAKIIAGTQAVYGEALFRKQYGEILPVDSDRVRESTDGMNLQLANRTLTLLHTPGHARHHLCIWDPASRGIFAGDTFGIAYRELMPDGPSHVLLPSTPIDFNPEAWHDSLTRLLALDPQRMYLTHYGPVEETQRLALALHQQIDAYRAIASGITGSNRVQLIEQQLTEYHCQRLSELGCPLDNRDIRRVLGMDLRLCAQGLDIWLKRQEQG